MATTCSESPERSALSTGPSSLARMVREAWDRAEQRLSLLGGLGCLGLLGLVFGPNLRHFVFIWSTDDNYSHGFLVPFISLYFANEAAKRGPTPIRGGVALGVGLLSLSVLARLATILVPVGFVSDLGFLAGLAGLCALLLGAGALRQYGFALFFLIFMIPLPIALYTRIASPLQLLVSDVASSLLNSIGIPVLREGNLMTLPGDVRMFVAEACSGMRQLTGFLALTTAVAYLGARPFWHRALVVASAIPIAMTANIVRVTLTGWIMYDIDPQYALGTYHTLEGLLMMGFGLALLAAECGVLNYVTGELSAFSGQRSASVTGELSAVSSQRLALKIGNGAELEGLSGPDGSGRRGMS
jgi:exosortase